MGRFLELLRLFYQLGDYLPLLLGIAGAVEHARAEREDDGTITNAEVADVIGTYLKSNLDSVPGEWGDGAGFIADALLAYAKAQGEEPGPD